MFFIGIIFDEGENQLKNQFNSLEQKAKSFINKVLENTLKLVFL